jgi:hypothetical protein
MDLRREKIKEQIMAIYNLSKDYDIDFEAILESIIEEEDDFTVDDYRFIHKVAIDRIMDKSLESDTYLLGMFNAEFLAEIIEISSRLIEIIQKVEAWEELGEYIVSRDLISELREEYVSADGYGHYFASYDSETMEDILKETGYYVFRN